jgi:ribonuclease P protein component
VQLLYLPNLLEKSRLGLAVGMRLGKAVERNRLKRRLREIIRRNGAAIVGGFDVVVLVRPQARDADFSAITSDFLDLFGRLKNRKVGSL